MREGLELYGFEALKYGKKSSKDFEELINGMGHNDYPYYRG